MDKHLCKVSISGKSFFIFTNMPSSINDLKGTTSLHGKSSFDVCVSNGKDMFNGKVSVTDVINMASQVDIEEDKFYNSLKQCLCNSTKNSPTQFTYQMIENGESSFQFVWKQDIGDEMKFQLGTMLLHKEDEPAVKTGEIFEFLMLQLSFLRDEVTTLNNINRNLESEKKGMTKRLEGYVDAKETLEQQLYTKFSLVLNEKKARIRELKGKLDGGNDSNKEKADKRKREDRSDGEDSNISNSDGNMDTDEEKERSTKMKSIKTTPNIILESNIDDSKDDVPKKNKKRVRTSKPKTSAHSILPRTTSLPRPTKQSSETNTSSTKNLKTKVTTEEDLLDELMF